ncbi:uncharacterized protein LOC102156984 isoform X1 [Canis lupus familiaris]|uniref:uncharacterized protein LOC102156984 isoform X1 n=1 Tax=Canis lupus familiaris TaxID=9615 RepID=UPI0018F4BE13|nr:uncharacterized protein LOC102156984 isoform X1 [Canis lupus familiaris]
MVTLGNFIKIKMWLIASLNLSQLKAGGPGGWGPRSLAREAPRTAVGGSAAAPGSAAAIPPSVSGHVTPKPGSSGLLPGGKCENAARRSRSSRRLRAPFSDPVPRPRRPHDSCPDASRSRSATHRVSYRTGPSSWPWRGGAPCPPRPLITFRMIGLRASRGACREALPPGEMLRFFGCRPRQPGAQDREAWLCRHLHLLQVPSHLCSRRSPSPGASPPPAALACASGNYQDSGPASERVAAGAPTRKPARRRGECCAQDRESEKPPRRRHRCKHTRVYSQARAWLQVHPTQRSRDLDPETKRRSSFVGARGPWDCNIRRKLHSHVGPHAGGRLNYILLL